MRNDEKCKARANAVVTQDALRQTGSRLAMPTLLACAAACLALVIAVGLQAPAVSAGPRWTPGPRFGPKRIPVEAVTIEWDPSFPPGDGWPTWATWMLAVLAAFLVGRWIRHLTRRPPRTNAARIRADSGVLSEADAQILKSGLAAAIERLSSSDRDLGNAVVQAWQGLEDAAAAAGLHRRPAETASEFTARILYRSRKSTEPIAVLLNLYQRVRFGEHTPDADEIATARHSLEVLVSLWQADFPERRRATGVR